MAEVGLERWWRKIGRFSVADSTSFALQLFEISSFCISVLGWTRRSWDKMRDFPNGRGSPCCTPRWAGDPMDEDKELCGGRRSLLCHPVLQDTSAVVNIEDQVRDLVPLTDCLRSY